MRQNDAPEIAQQRFEKMRRTNQVLLNVMRKRKTN
jgi:hypothetical protein